MYNVNFCSEKFPLTKKTKCILSFTAWYPQAYVIKTYKNWTDAFLIHKLKLQQSNVAKPVCVCVCVWYYAAVTCGNQASTVSTDITTITENDFISFFFLSDWWATVISGQCAI